MKSVGFPSQLVLLLPFLRIAATMQLLECFSCTSNANWSYYMDRIDGLKPLNGSEALPVAPVECTFDPMRIYADRTAISCKSYCVKWAFVKILDDGGLEVNFLRGCLDRIMRSGFKPPDGDRCYQTPSDFSHKPGVEYRSMCYCKGFMCNTAAICSSFMNILLILCLLFLLQ